MNKDIRHLRMGIDSLSVFSSLKEDPVIRSLRALFLLLEKREPDCTASADAVQLYSQIAAALYPHTSDLSEYIQRIALSDDNFYVRAVAAGTSPGDAVQDAARADLQALQDLALLSSSELAAHVMRLEGEDDLVLPSWSNHSIHLLSDFTEKLLHLPSTGYGIFAEHSFFLATDSGLLPILHPDVQSLSSLYGYTLQREKIIQNTQALLSGKGASNMLLYGDAGTGKSSTIKAVAGEYASQGLRIIEIKKEQLRLLPGIMEELSLQPLKFILFIDDLSFSGNDDNFSALKACLEGSLSGRSLNTAIFATSNRRHLIREKFSDREGEELHINDTLQETMSLAARFGLTITFEKPDKDEYLYIVKELAKEAGIDMDEEELLRRAEAHAIRRNGRSPRTARQFVELLSSGIIR